MAENNKESENVVESEDPKPKLPKKMDLGNIVRDFFTRWKRGNTESSITPDILSHLPESSNKTESFNAGSAPKIKNVESQIPVRGRSFEVLSTRKPNQAQPLTFPTPNKVLTAVINPNKANTPDGQAKTLSKPNSPKQLSANKVIPVPIKPNVSQQSEVQKAKPLPKQFPTQTGVPIKLNDSRQNSAQSSSVRSSTSQSPRISKLLSTNTFNYDKYQQYKQMAENAYKNRKIFTIFGGYQAVRDALLRRGWLERFFEKQRMDLQRLSHHTLLLKSEPNNQFEAAAISKLLQQYPSNFIWYPRNMNMNQFDAVVPFKSRLSRNREFDFSLKCGLVNIIRNSHWYYIPGRSELASPRSYRSFLQEEMNDFMDDFRFTGCTSLLSYIVDGIIPNGDNKRFSSTAIVSLNCIKFAITRVRERIRVQQHEDIDGFYPERLQSLQWRTFFQDYHATVRQGAKFKYSPEVDSLVKSCSSLLATAKMLWPTIATDGYRNIWMVKLAGSSRGIGVSVMENNLSIIDYIARNKNCRYVIQKYLERPLLIYNTKFDIRQYFLVVGRTNSIQVWMYKMCYLKFSSQEFSLQNYHESVHLTNHFVQKNYANSKNRSSLLPSCNMWSSDQFKAYLLTIDKPDAWAGHIYPSMKRNIVAAVRCTYDEGAELEPNCFELFGADFMLTDSMDSLLLEVNATPDMNHSTPVTRIMCPQCLDDVVKVIVDQGRNVNAPTGNFELAFEIYLPRSLPHPPLRVNGQSFKSLQRYRQFTPPAKPILRKSNSSPKSYSSVKQSNFARPATAPSSMYGARKNTEPAPQSNLGRLDLSKYHSRGTPRSGLSDQRPLNVRVPYVVPKQCLPLGMSKEVTRLMELNKTIERLLNMV